MISVGIHTCQFQVMNKLIIRGSFSFCLMISSFELMILAFSLIGSDPLTCVFATSTRDHPIHLWDSSSGEVLIFS